MCRQSFQRMDSGLRSIQSPWDRYDDWWMCWGRISTNHGQDWLWIFGSSLCEKAFSSNCHGRRKRAHTFFFWAPRMAWSYWSWFSENENICYVYCMMIYLHVADIILLSHVSFADYLILVTLCQDGSDVSFGRQCRWGWPQGQKVLLFFFLPLSMRHAGRYIYIYLVCIFVYTYIYIYSCILSNLYV